MRSFLAAILGLLAIVIGTLAAPATWVERNIVDANGYAAFVDPLGRDADFQRSLAGALTASLLEDSELPGRAQELAQPGIVKVATQLTAAEGYPDAWTETNRRSHWLLFGDDPADAEGPAAANADPLNVDVAPLGELLADQVKDSLDLPVKSPDPILVQVGGSSERELVDTAKRLDPRAYRMAGIAAALALLSLIVARRRSVAVWWLGLGTLLSAGLLKLATDAVFPFLADGAAASSPLAGDLQELIVQAAVDSFDGWILVIAVVGLVVTVIGGISRIALSRMADRPEQSAELGA